MKRVDDCMGIGAGRENLDMTTSHVTSDASRLSKKYINAKETLGYSLNVELRMTNYTRKTANNKNCFQESVICF